MQDANTVLCEIDGAIARLTLSNPARLNALTSSMLRALEEHVARIESEPSVRVVLVDGQGDRAFSAGADIREWGVLTPQAMGRRWIREGNRVFERLSELDAVIIAVLGGEVYGGGLELALAADLRLAAEGIRIGFPEVALAAVPGWLGCARLQELVGPGRARQMILTGAPIDAVTAERWGLVNEVHPRARLRARAAEIGAQIAARSAIAVSAAKRLLNAGLSAPRLASMHELAATACLASADAAEGLAAFREKRQPDFGDPCL